MRPVRATVLAVLGALSLGSCTSGPRSLPLGPDRLSGARWVGSSDGAATRVLVQSEVGDRTGGEVTLEVLGIPAFRVVVDDREMLRATDEEMRHHLAKLDLRGALRPGGGSSIAIEAIGSQARPPAVIARLSLRRRLGDGGIVTGGPGWRAADGSPLHPVESSEGFLRPPLPAVPRLPLAVLPPVAATAPAMEGPFHLEGLRTGYVDVAFAGPSRGMLAYLGRGGEVLATEPFHAGDAGVFASMGRRTCAAVRVLPEAGASEPVRVSLHVVGAVVDREPAAFRCSDAGLERLERQSCATAARVAQGFLEDGSAEPTLQVALMRPAALALAVAHGHYRTTRRTLDLLAEGRRASGSIRAVYPQEGESPIDEPAEASAAFVIAVRDYCLHSGDLQAARRFWPEVDRQLELLQRRRGASRLLLSSPRGQHPPHHLLEPNVQYAGALLAGADLAQWLGRINAGRLRREAEAVRLALVRRLFHRARGLYASSDDPALAWDRSMRSGNALAVLFGVAPERGSPASAVLGRLAASDVPASPLALALEAEAYWLLGEPDRGAESLRALAGLPGDSLRPSAAAAETAPAWILRAFALGVRPTSPGYRTFLIDPLPGALELVSGQVMTPAGAIAVEIRHAGGRMDVSVDVPSGITGSFVVRSGVPVALDGTVVAPRDGHVRIPVGKHTLVAGT